MTNKDTGSSKQAATNTGALRDRAIAEYHQLLAADEDLSPAAFEKLRSAALLARNLTKTFSDAKRESSQNASKGYGYSQRFCQASANRS
jgi:hypothetical protein